MRLCEYVMFTYVIYTVSTSITIHVIICVCVCVCVRVRVCSTLGVVLISHTPHMAATHMAY